MSRRFPRRKSLVRDRQRASSRRRHYSLGRPEALETRTLLAGDVVNPFHNAADPPDVNNDGIYSINDVLLVVNELRRTGPRQLTLPLASSGEAEGEHHHNFVDVNGDQILSVNDALMVIQQLRAEGEPDTFEVQEDSIANEFDVLANDGSATAILSVFNFSHGGSAVIQNNRILYTPAANFFGVETFQYLNNLSAIVNVTVTVHAVNDPPTANPDEFFGVPSEGGRGVAMNSSNNTLDVLANDSNFPDEPGTETLTVVSAGNTTNGGTVSVNPDGTINYTPAAHFYGKERFTYVLSDGSPLTATGQVTVEVVPTQAVVKYRAVVVDPTTGQPIDQVEVGQRVDVQVYIQDLRHESVPDRGIVAAFMDLLHDADKLLLRTVPASENPHNFTRDVRFSAYYGVTLPTISSTQPPGEVNEIGSAADLVNLNRPPAGGGEVLFVTVGFVATAPGVATLTPDLPDVVGNEILLDSPSETNPVYQPTATSLFAFDGVTPRFMMVADTVTIVAPVQANNDSLTVNEDSVANVLNPLTNDTVTAGGQFTITAVGPRSHGGTVTITNGGTRLSYTPVANFFGTETFTYTIADGRGNTSTATVTMTVLNVNDPPVAVNDAFTVDQDTVGNLLDVLANDHPGVDPPDEVLTVSAVSQGNQGGSVSIGPGNTSVLYTPATGFFGTETFTYTIRDPGGLTATATVTMTVDEVILFPRARPDVYNILEDSGQHTLEVLENDEASVGGVLEITDFTQPANGVLTLFNGGPFGDYFVYEADDNFFGTDTFTYTIDDSNAPNNDGPSQTTVTIFVAAVNDPPTIDPIANPAPIDEDAPQQTINLTGITAGPLESQALQVTATSNNTAVIPNPTVTYTSPNTTGQLRYTPVPNAFGTAVITVTVRDAGLDGILGNADDATTSVQFTVVVNPVNDPPTLNAIPNPAPIPEDSPQQTINLSGITAGGGESQALQVTATSNNTAVIPNPTVTYTSPSTTGQLRYTPVPDAFGTAVITVTVRDAGIDGILGNADDATFSRQFTVVVTAVQDPPVAVDDFEFVIEDEVSLLNVLANDFDVDGDPLTITAVGASAAGATVTIANAGTRVEYTPPTGFIGTDTFTYTISDGQGNSATATVNVTVDPAALPRARANRFTVLEDSVDNEFDVLVNDLASTGGTLTITGVGTPSHGGTVVIDDNGTPSDPTDDFLRYTPAPDFFGTETFTYTIEDDGTIDNEGPNTGVVTVTVLNVNDPPTANDNLFTGILEDSVNNLLDVLANDSIFPDVGETLTIVGLGPTSHGGVVSIAQNGTRVSYTPAPDFFGTETFTYTIDDGNGGSDSATVTVVVDNVNDPPTANDDLFTGILEDTVDNLLDPLANDSIFPDINETLTIVGVGATSHGGVATIVNNGTAISYTPAPDFFGAETFSYTIDDGNGGTAMATITVVVDNVNDDPTANDDFFPRILTDSIENLLDVLANDSIFPDINETLTIVGVTTPDQGGSVTISADCSRIEYTPAAGFEGIERFSYTIADGNGGFDTALVEVEVVNFLPGSFGGYVFDDVNRDNQHGHNEQPYEGVPVRLVGTDFLGNPVDLTVYTDRFGYYLFADLVPGSYTITVERPAFTLFSGLMADGDNGSTSNGASFEFEFGILDGVHSTQNHLRLSGIDPTTGGLSLWDFLASSSGNQIITAVRTNGDQGWASFRTGWEGYEDAEVRLLDANTVELKVTDMHGVRHTVLIPAVNGTQNGPRFRIMAQVGDMLLLRIVATPEQLGLPTM